MSSEYSSTFRPFSDYVYVAGRFALASNVNTDAVDSGSQATGHGAPWHSEVTELRKTANKYKVRGWGKETALPHLTKLYNACENVIERNIITALSLDTMQPEFLKQSRGRITALSDGARGRQRSQPPISRHSSRADHTPRTGVYKRPSSAQQVYRAGYVDKADGKVTARTSSSKTTCRSSPVAYKNKESNSREQKANAKGSTTPTSSNGTRATTPRQAPAKANKRPQKAAAKPGESSIRGNERKNASNPSETPLSRDKIICENTKSSSPKNPVHPVTPKTASGSALVDTTPARTPSAQDHRSTEKGSSAYDQLDMNIQQADCRTDKAEQLTSFERQTSVSSAVEPTTVKSPDSAAAGSVTSPQRVNWTVPFDNSRVLVVTQQLPSDIEHEAADARQHEAMASSHSSMMTSQMGMTCSFYPEEDASAPAQAMWTSQNVNGSDNNEHETRCKDIQSAFSGNTAELSATEPLIDAGADTSHTALLNAPDSCSDGVGNTTGNVSCSAGPSQEAHTHVHDAASVEMAAQMMTAGSAFCFSSTSAADEREGRTPAVDLLAGDDTRHHASFSTQNLFGSTGLAPVVTTHIDKPTYRVI